MRARRFWGKVNRMGFCAREAIYSHLPSNPLFSVFLGVLKQLIGGKWIFGGNLLERGSRAFLGEGVYVILFLGKPQKERMQKILLILPKK